jgi:hypothetical protein
MWLNIPLMAVVYLAVCGIPLWLVLKRPDFSGEPAGRSAAPADADAVRYVTTKAAAGAQLPPSSGERRELAGAGQRG